MEGMVKGGGQGMLIKTSGCGKAVVPLCAAHAAPQLSSATCPQSCSHSLCFARYSWFCDAHIHRPWTTWLPLAFVLGVSMIKEAVEDYKRHKADNEINNRKVRVLNPETKQFEDRRWMDVCVGQVLQVRWAGAGRGSWSL